ncbi:hypothetical protein ACLMAL_26320 [Nocardia sp. CWNU-33]
MDRIVIDQRGQEHFRDTKKRRTSRLKPNQPPKPAESDPGVEEGNASA